MPFVWQFGGALFTLSGYLNGTNELSDVSLHVATLSFITGVYLSLFIRDRREPEDVYAVAGYFLYAAGFGLLSSPNRFLPAEWTIATYFLGALCIVLLLPLTWMFYLECFAE